MIPIAATEALYYGEVTFASTLLALIVVVPLVIVFGFFVVMGLRLLKAVAWDVREKTE